MSDPGFGTSPLKVGSIVASSPNELPQARKMKDESHIVGRDDFVEKIVSQLIDKRGDCANLSGISVLGEGAMGKTALVRSVCNRVDIKNHFDCCVWVRVGPKPNLVHLMADLLKQLRVPELRDVDRMAEEKLSDELVRVLMGCRYLIVLDDLCELHVMDELMMALADSRNGSRVMVTTRNRHIAYSIDPWYFKPLTLSPLDEEQSEKLLEKCCPNPPENLLPLKDTILSKSGGSPQNILLLGGLLSATTSDRRTELANGLPDRPALQDVVRLSVDHLPEGLKQCALYLALFPREYEIPTRRLFRLWSAENLVSSPSENGVNRVDAGECFETLVSRNLVHVARQKWDGSARSCRLPGPLHDAFYQMAKNERFLKIYDRSIHNERKFDALRIAIHRNISGGEEAKVQTNVPEAGRKRLETNAQEAHMEITPAEPHRRMSTSNSSTPCGIQQLYSYVSFNTMKLGTRAKEIVVLLKPIVPKRDSSLLWVLDLEGVYKPLLPEELGNIVPNLKYLGLRWTLLERLPKSVALLSRLETLDLKYTNISSLPESILEAENLRHLYMPKVDFDCSTYQLFSKKSLNCNIQTIWGLVIDYGSLMFGVLSKLTGLRKLALTTNFMVLEATKHILNLKMLKSLRLRLTGDSPGEMSDMSRLKSLSNLYLIDVYWGMSSLSESHIPPNLKVLTLYMSILHDDPMGVLGKLKCLTTLRLFASSYAGKTLNVSEGTFPSLRVLKLWKLYDLTKWTIQANAMQCLEDLEIKHCKKLKTIDGLQQIKTLEVITLVRVPDELERSVRVKQPDGRIIVKKLCELKEQSDQEDGDGRIIAKDLWELEKQSDQEDGDGRIIVKDLCEFKEQSYQEDGDGRIIAKDLWELEEQSDQEDGE